MAHLTLSMCPGDPEHVASILNRMVQASQVPIQDLTIVLVTLLAAPSSPSSPNNGLYAREMLESERTASSTTMMIAATTTN